MVFLQSQISFYKEFSKENSDSALELLEIDPKEIELCVNNSFDFPGNYQSDNRFLREDREWQNL